MTGKKVINRSNFATLGHLFLQSKLTGIAESENGLPLISRTLVWMLQSGDYTLSTAWVTPPSGRFLHPLAAENFWQLIHKPTEAEITHIWKVLFEWHRPDKDELRREERAFPRPERRTADERSASPPAAADDDDRSRTPSPTDSVKSEDASSRPPGYGNTTNNGTQYDMGTTPDEQAAGRRARATGEAHAFNATQERSEDEKYDDWFERNIREAPCYFSNNPGLTFPGREEVVMGTWARADRYWGVSFAQAQAMVDGDRADDAADAAAAQDSMGASHTRYVSESDEEQTEAADRSTPDAAPPAAPAAGAPGASGGISPPARHAESSQIPGMRMTTSELQGHGVDEPEALDEALARSRVENFASEPQDEPESPPLAENYMEIAAQYRQRTAAAAAAAAPRAARDPSLEDRETDSPKPEDMWDEA